MLGSSSYSSEEDHPDHNHPSPSDMSRHPPRCITTTYQCQQLISSTSSSSILAAPPRQLLISCAELISRFEFSSANCLLSLLSSHLASPSGDSTERLVFYFCKALDHRVKNSYLSSCRSIGFNPSNGSSIGTPLASSFLFSQPSVHVQVASSARVGYLTYLALNQVTPFIRFAHLTANQAILEAIEGYKAVHILDMDIMHGVQWPPLLQAIGERSATLGHPAPTIRITGGGRDLELLNRTGDRIRKFAQSLGLKFQFHHLIMVDSNLTEAVEAINALELHLHFQEEEEVLALHCGDFLHRLLREYDTTFLRRFLHKVKILNPRVFTVGEREADHNHPLFLRRFIEAIDHYGAVFDSLEATLPPLSQERVAVEERWFGEEIKDVIGQEGEPRRQRHQKYESWEAVMRSSGFKSLPLSPFSVSQAKLLLRLHYPSEGYQLQVFHSNCLLLGWKNRPLFSVSSWQ
uniref:Uncharacterized protein n=1 Tax=Opuntia streptacantha TaxID=393608 RepID=A0A7C9E411_OPUST